MLAYEAYSLTVGSSARCHQKRPVFFSIKRVCVHPTLCPSAWENLPVEALMLSLSQPFSQNAYSLSHRLFNSTCLPSTSTSLLAPSCPLSFVLPLSPQAHTLVPFAHSLDPLLRYLRTTTLSDWTLSSVHPSVRPSDSHKSSLSNHLQYSTCEYKKHDNI
ncbi:unnamed protein product [Protopolystoma xenopodis]|uniref:Uncharacterized protein n=1 Tax=Protopolystoma xenopodis TaxID=117903 RepID=A0A448XSW8_9PLAT|nr:unnamed protein product [Protopolystoma xenopodis]